VRPYVGMGLRIAPGYSAFMDALRASQVAQPITYARFHHAAIIACFR
jgi:hypothetical protein